VPLRIFYSSRTNDMVDRLVESLRQGGFDPGLARCVLLPSKPLIERVRVKLARRAGVAMGVHFTLPAAFTDTVSVALGLPPLHASWTPEGMAWRVFELLGPLAQEQPRLRPACADLRSRLALAREIADRFDQYMHFRPDLIAAWDLGETFNQRIKKHKHLAALFSEGLPESSLADEAWQMLLWSRLKASIGDAPHPKARMDRLVELTKDGDFSSLGPEIEVLATGPLPYPLLRLLHALSARLSVNLGVLMPSAEYLDGIKTKVAQWGAGEDEDLQVEAHPLLAQMGRQSIEAFKGLMSLSEEGQEDSYSPESEDGRPTLLARLQDDIRRVRQPDPLERPVDERPLRSLRVHRCYGPRREVEALRDELLRAFEDLEDLQPEEVLILTPDLELYGPLVEAVLAKGLEPRLPLAMAEQSLERSDPLFKALRALVELACGRGALSELLAFLDLPALRERLGEAGADLLAARLRASGITFGFNAAHRGALGAGSNGTGTWRAGLDRLAAGLWLGEAPAAADQAREALLPVAGEIGNNVAEFVEALAWCEGLLRVLLEWQEEARPLDWAARIEAAYKELLESPASSLDSTNALALMESLRRAGLDHGCVLPMDAACVADHFRSQDAEATRRVGDVGGRIALGGFKPLRALPCRVLAVLGLSDSAFPRRGQAPAWDLLSAKHMPGDRDPRKEDRQLFLDAILAAQDRVILSAPARSQITDKAAPVSVCLDELGRAALATLCAAGTSKEGLEAGLKGIVLDHPLQPFSPRNFEGPEPSYDAGGLAVARVLAQARVEEPFAGPGSEAAGAKDAPADLEALIAFFRDPARAWLKSLGLSPAQRQDEATQDDDEPVDMDALQQWKLAELALAQALDGPQEEAFFLERLAADRVLPLGALGQRAGALALERARVLAAALEQETGGPPRAFACKAMLASGPLEGVLHRAGPAGLKLLWTSSALGVPPRGSVDAKAALILEAWLKACLASAAKDRGPMLVAAFDKESKAPVVLELPAPEEAEARASLEKLLDLRARGLTRLFPFAPETSAAMARAALEGGDVLEAAEGEWLGNEWRPGSGEAPKPSYARAWRGQDPLSAPLFDPWMACALEVWKAPLGWWSQAKLRRGPA
jgi:exodeoxyribonuclease V gamma subunit